MSISKQMDKKAVVHIHNGVLLSHWKGYIWISSSEVDCGLLYRLGPGDWSWWKEREKERKSNIPWVMWKANKAHTQVLYHSRRHRASSQGGLESLGEKVSSAGLHAPKNLLETREGYEGPKSLVEQGYFIRRNTCLYIFSKIITHPLKRMKFHQLQQNG